MTIKDLVDMWFAVWESGDFEQIPITEDFKHTSPFGTVDGKTPYLAQVEANRDKFLGYQFKILDSLYEGNRACVRYTAIQSDFRLDVSEWHYAKDGLISEIVAYYHIGEIREGRLLIDDS